MKFSGTHLTFGVILTSRRLPGGATFGRGRDCWLAAAHGVERERAKCAHHAERSNLPESTGNFQVLQVSSYGDERQMTHCAPFEPTTPHDTPPPSQPSSSSSAHTPLPHPLAITSTILTTPPTSLSITQRASSEPVTISPKWLFIQKCFINERHSPCHLSKSRGTQWCRCCKVMSFSLIICLKADNVFLSPQW